MPQTPVHPPSFAWRVLLALAVTAAFYVFGVGLIWAALFLGATGRGLPITPTMVLSTLALAVVLLVIALPRAGKFRAPGPRLSAAEHPLLFERLEKIAAAAGTKMPDEVYLIWDHDAYVMHVGVLRQRRILGIGYPFLCVLDISEFTAIMAHEFGHYRARHPFLSPWIFRAQLVVTHTLDKAARWPELIRAPFEIYGDLFTRATRAVSRDQEFAADRFAASVAGPAIMISALGKIVGYKQLVDATWEYFTRPALIRGYRPRIAEGLLPLFLDPAMAAASRKFADAIIAGETSSPFTHPRLRDRMEALQALPPGEAPPADEADSAFVLLGDMASLEAGLLAAMVPAEKIGALRPIEWSDIADRVYVDEWTRLRELNRAALATWTADELGGLGHLPIDLMRDQQGNPVKPDDYPATVGRIANACLSLVLMEAGWQFVARPDMGLFFVRDNGRKDHLDTEMIVRDMAKGKVEQDYWREFCVTAGISGRLLDGGGSSEPGTRWRPLHPTRALAALGITLEGGDGSSFKKRIILAGATSEAACIEAERHAIDALFGPVNRKWRATGRRSAEEKNRQVHIVDVVLADGSKRSVIFDVTASAANWMKDNPEPRADARA